MALSNIFREPKRELIESALGLIPFSAWLVGDYYFANWFYTATGGAKDGCPLILGMVFFGPIFTIMLVAIAFAILFGTHAIGELICDALEVRGIHLRPRQRQ